MARSSDDELGGRSVVSVRELDIDELVRELEDRILADLDRRGGRNAGWF